MQRVPDIEKLARAAGSAPSPDNNQPWRMVVGADFLEIQLDRTRSLPSDVNGMFDLTAIGAAVENACIAAREEGFEPVYQSMLAGEQPLDVGTANLPVGRVKRPLKSSQHTPCADESFWECGARGVSGLRLGAWIEERQTSRGPYSRKPLPEESLRRLSGEMSGFPNVRMHWLTERPSIRTFAWLVGQSDRLRFEQEAFHRELFRQLRFTPQQADETRDGLDLRVLALPPLGKLLLRVISNWRVLAAANRFGASMLLSLPSVISVIQSGAIGMISVDRAAADQFVAGGRAFQRLWLAATAEGLSLHPLGSLPIFLAHLEQLHGTRLTNAQNRRCEQVKKRLHRLAPDLAGRTLLIAFRLGYGRACRFRSQRRDIDAVYSKN